MSRIWNDPALKMLTIATAIIVLFALTNCKF